MGGNVFGNTKEIKREHIIPTLDIYFDCLKVMFPAKGSIFNTDHFTPVGSVGKKEYSGDIDLAVDTKDLIPEWSEEECVKWNTSLVEVEKLAHQYKKRARTATLDECMVRALLTKIHDSISNGLHLIEVHEKKITSGNMFTSAIQHNEQFQSLGSSVQVDWMIGEKELLMFSYYSDSYEGNVKGLHRTQAILAMFHVLGYSFNHTKGLSDRASGKKITTSPAEMMKILSERLHQIITVKSAENYFFLVDLFRKTPYYEEWKQAYFKILDTTRCDIPYDLQAEWIQLKNEMNLTGKFLPDDSMLYEYITKD